MDVAIPLDSAAAAERVFNLLPTLRATPVDGAALPDPAALRLAVRSIGEIPEHNHRHFGDWCSRDNPQRSAYLRGELATLGFEKAYFVSLGDQGSPWWRVEPQEPLHWLESLVRCRDDGAREGKSPIRSRWGNGLEDLSVLSSDGQRALILASREDDLISFHLPTRILVQRTEAGLRLLELAKDLIPGSRNPPKTPRELLRWRPGVSGFQEFSRGVCAEALIPGPACLRRWRCEPNEDRNTFFAQVFASLAEGWPQSGRYSLSIGAFGPLTWTEVGQRPPHWIVDLWRHGSLNRLFVWCKRGAEDQQDLILGFLAQEAAIEAFLYPWDDLWMA